MSKYLSYLYLHSILASRIPVGPAREAGGTDHRHTACVSRSRGERDEEAMIIPLLQRELSIDDFVDADEECRLGVLLADPKAENQEDRIYEQEINHLVSQALVSLDDRERHIIRNRFGLLGGREQTLEEIGKRLNLSRERVRQLEREAKNKLRANLIRHRAHVRYSLA